MNEMDDSSASEACIHDQPSCEMNELSCEGFKASYESALVCYGKPSIWTSSLVKLNPS